ncbi:hypothetical protein [Caldimonas thermodepolymerans]|jgi:hypothetical protein|uniref:hypothetical protein n=1 Tax=Caldimonas thermodepolymerans TaxID=215580 RepID=UPI00248F5E9F|nr:hypothetical protein [Caldimonas thermodepolymerans]
MSRYRKIEVRTWTDAKFRKLTPIPPCGQGLWFFLLTGPFTGPIPGLFRAGRAAMAEELGWSTEAFDEAFREVSEQGMAEADFTARLVWLPKALNYNRPENPNVVKSWRAELDLLPECELKHRALAAIREHLQTLGNAYVAALFGDESPVEKHIEKPSPKPSGKPLPKDMPNQEQEQEQEQEKDIGGHPAAAPQLPLPGDPPPPADLASRKAQRLRQVAEEAREAYNRILAKPHGLLTACTVLNKPRLKAVEKALPTARAICRQLSGDDRVTPEFWNALFEAAAKDDFLAGRGPYRPPHENWRPDFEYLLRESVIAKLFDREMTEDAA